MEDFGVLVLRRTKACPAAGFTSLPPLGFSVLRIYIEEEWPSTVTGFVLPQRRYAAARTCFPSFIFYIKDNASSHLA